MNSKVAELKELHSLLLAKAITNSEYDILKKEIIEGGSKEKKNDDDFLVSIPDVNFQKVLSEKYNVEINDHKTNFDSIKNIKKIECEMSEISSLEGIEHFKALEHLDCSFNQVKYLDVSKNKNLIELHFVQNQIENIDISNNTSLTTFVGNYNYLWKLDISKNPNLKTLFCSNNELETLTTSGNNLPEKMHLVGNDGDWWLKYQNI